MVYSGFNSLGIITPALRQPLLHHSERLIFSVLWGLADDEENYYFRSLDNLTVAISDISKEGHTLGNLYGCVEDGLQAASLRPRIRSLCDCAQNVPTIGKQRSTQLEAMRN